MASAKATTDVPRATVGLSDKDLMGLLDRLIAERGGQELSLERLLWKAESCGQFTITGHLLDCVDMPKADRKDNPDWKAFIIRTTYETRAVNRNKEVVKAPPKSEIVVPANYQLAVNLARFALDPEYIHEIAIQATERSDIGGGKKMWNFRVVKLPDGVIKRVGVDRLPEAVTKALPAHDPETGEVFESAAAAAS